MIAVAGSLIADVWTYPVDQLPQKGTLGLVDEIGVHLGGAVSNTGAALAKLNVPVAVVGRVGKDALGELVAEETARWAQALYISQDEERPTSSVIAMVHPDGERTFLYAPGACAHFGAEDVNLERLVAEGVRALHLGYALLLPALDGPPMVKLLDRARDLGLLVSLDVVWNPAANWGKLLPVLPCVDLFCPNFQEAQAITGTSDPADAAKALLKAGVRQVVVIKLGKDGCYVQPVGMNGKYFPGHSVKAVDTTGAGDAFIAGMLASWYRGLDWISAAQLANVVGALAVTGLGAAEGVNSWAETLSLAKGG